MKEIRKHTYSIEGGGMTFLYVLSQANGLVIEYPDSSEDVLLHHHVEDFTLQLSEELSPVTKVL